MNCSQTGMSKATAHQPRTAVPSALPSYKSPSRRDTACKASPSRRDILAATGFGVVVAQSPAADAVQGLTAGRIPGMRRVPIHYEYTISPYLTSSCYLWWRSKPYCHARVLTLTAWAVVIEHLSCACRAYPGPGNARIRCLRTSDWKIRWAWHWMVRDPTVPVPGPRDLGGSACLYCRPRRY